MYRKRSGEPPLGEFSFPFSGRLRSDNRWVRLAKLIPWAPIEEQYAKHFSAAGIGAPAKPVRVALGVLIIKEKLANRRQSTGSADSFQLGALEGTG